MNARATRQTKPVAEAVKEAVDALSEVLRSLRAGARDASGRLRHEARGLETDVRRARNRIEDRLGRAWRALTQDEPEAKPAGRRAPRAAPSRRRRGA